MIIDRLHGEVIKNGPICLGLDTKEEYLPMFIANTDLTLGEKIFRFNKDIIDRTIDLVACYKVQIACYEALGLEGLIAYSKTVKYLQHCQKIVIGDIKRGDISSTQFMYGKGHFEGDFETDFITVNSYMGEDTISPLYDYIIKDEKGVFILLKTSNPSSKEIQDIKCDDGQLYIRMAKLINEWSYKFIGKCGYSSIGAVVGLTYPEEFKAISDLMPHTFFLVPGYGAQGGQGKDLVEAIGGKNRAVINSSRGLITAHKGIKEDSNYCEEIRKATIAMKEDLEYWLK